MPEALPASVPGMIRALEDFLSATRPSGPPAPPREKTPAEIQLEKLLFELSKPAPLAPPPEPPAQLALSPIPEPEIPKPIIKKTLPPAPAAPRPEPPADEAPSRHPILTALLLAAAAAPWLWRSKPAPAPASAAPKTTAKTAAPRAVEKLPEEPAARARALVLAYRPQGGPVTTREIFQSISPDLDAGGDWEVKPLGDGTYTVAFSPFRQALGEAGTYQFAVDPRYGKVRPTAGTAERLRVDALGLLASRSDFQAFGQLLQLGR